MTMRRLLAWLVAAAAALAPSAARTQTMTVSAAASLADAMREIGARFEAARPGVTVRLNTAGSGVLIQQIIQGAPVDVFVSADAETVARGIERRVLDAATRRDIARNALVMIVPARGGPAPAALAGLVRPEVRRIAIGKPAIVPAGRYARQALESANLWAAVEPRLVFVDTPRQVLDVVARGEVEAGFVYRTDVALMPDRVRVAVTAGGHAPIVYPAAVVVDSRQPTLARAFHAFLSGAEAQAILARFGFGPP
jgi:molybdate transport system substrate-binding protein